MNDVLAVQFAPYGTLHFLQCDADFEAEVGDKVLYPTDNGSAVAHVAWRGCIDDTTKLPKCLGHATEDDDADARQSRRKIAQIELTAVQLISDLGLNMRVLACDVEHSDDEELAIIYFQAPGRVDFRKLVSELAQALKMRIDLRQLPARDVAAIASDVGRCGRATCCTTWLQQYGNVRRLGKITDANAGVCGRTACCFGFEDR